jgi:preprotein translocase subunit SecF
MDKRKLHHMWRTLRKVHPWYFVIIMIIVGSTCLYALRRNNQGMIERRQAVYEADKNNGDVEGALRELRSYVYSHMNTSLTSGPNPVHPPIQLKYTYEREQAKQQAALGQNKSTLYYEAQQACDSNRNGLSASDTIACIESYAANRGVQLATINDAIYKFDFVSAKWSPDLAGWSLIATVLSFFGFIITSIIRWLARRAL